MGLVEKEHYEPTLHSEVEVIWEEMFEKENDILMRISSFYLQFKAAHPILKGPGEEEIVL